MTARFLLLLALVAGLAFGAGPVPGGQPLVTACGCALLPDATPCCTTPEGPASDAPLSAPTLSPLKSALAPVLRLLGTAPTLVAELPHASPRFTFASTASSRLARLCTRLI